jgi:Uri superfamily endonuclease
VIDAETGCWIWTGAIGPNGYARVGSISATRFFYSLLIGPVPKNWHLDHLCRRRSCINIFHLEPVTPAENVRRGLSAKLSIDKINEIRQQRIPAKVLAKKYGVRAEHIYKIRAGSRWK